MMITFVICFITVTVGTDRRARAAKDVHVMPMYLRGAPPAVSRAQTDGPKSERMPSHCKGWRD